METIAQISTPLGSGGIAIIRMSGDKAKDIAFDLFSSKNLTKENIEPRKLYLGKFKINEDAKERCMMVYFKAPFPLPVKMLLNFKFMVGNFWQQKFWIS